MPYLYVVGFLLGCCGVVFDVAYQSFIPGLVRREQLVEANSKVGTTASIAGITGPGVAGLLVQWLTPPVALLLDALSFGVSALSLGLIRATEPATPAAAVRRRLWGQIGAELGLVLGDPLLWANAACRATYMFFKSLLIAVLFLAFAWLLLAPIWPLRALPEPAMPITLAQ